MDEFDTTILVETPAETEAPPPFYLFNPLDFGLRTLKLTELPPEPDGRAVHKYLRAVDELSGLHGLNGVQTIGMAIYYAPDQRTLWKSRPSWTGGDWSQFRRAIEQLYPVQTRTIARALADLKEEKQGPGRDPCSTLRDYYTRFLDIVSLTDPGVRGTRPSDYQIARSFIQGIYSSDQQILLKKLQECEDSGKIPGPRHAYLFDQLMILRKISGSFVL